MTKKEIAAMVKNIGFPYAYYCFPNNTPQSPPFVCFYYTGSDDFIADGKNYQSIKNLRIEFYSDNKDFDTETKIGNILNQHGLVYVSDDTYIDSERMFMTVFETEVPIDDEESEVS
ncbi:MAG: hypothetical protein IJ766_03935 [Clostridia bacterium]|nr:hypothetical protein [Clostridia bacterium]